VPGPKKPASLFRYFNSSPGVIRLVVMMYVRFPLSLRNVEELLAERGFRHWRWHVAEVFVKFNGETHYLWRAVDHEGEVLEGYVAKRRPKSAAVRFLKKALKRHGQAETIATDGLKSYPAAMREVGNLERQEMAAGSTSVLKTRICHSDEESARCYGFGE
jgi:putative transposase